MGLVGFLVGSRMREDEAKYCQSELEAGRSIVTVHAGSQSGEAVKSLRRSGGHDLDCQKGVTGFELELTPQESWRRARRYHRVFVADGNRCKNRRLTMPKRRRSGDGAVRTSLMAAHVDGAFSIARIYQRVPFSAAFTCCNSELTAQALRRWKDGSVGSCWLPTWHAPSLKANQENDYARQEQTSLWSAPP
jgi:hypothetical protein